MVEEFGGGAIGADPVVPAKQVVNLAWWRVEPLNRYIDGHSAWRSRLLNSRIGFVPGEYAALEI